LLLVRDVTIRFGGIVALDHVSFDVLPGSIVGLIGPNGAGKTTMFNCITRLYTPASGSILFQGSDLLQDPPRAIVRRGLARTFQNVELCRRLTVLDNVLLGLHTQVTSGRLDFLSSALGRAPGRLNVRLVTVRSPPSGTWGSRGSPTSPSPASPSGR
jgi:branched-chain amino acid transport system ATP-binding protein